MNLPDLTEWNAALQPLFEKIRMEHPDLAPMVEWVQRRGYYYGDALGRGTTGCWGFGEVHITATAPTGEWWTYLNLLAEPTGIPLDQLMGLWGEYFREENEWTPEEQERRTTDIVHYPGEDIPSLLVNSTFAMRMFSMHSPWAVEFYEKTADLMFHAMRKSGLSKVLMRSESGFIANVQLPTEDGGRIQVLMPIRGWSGGQDEVGVPLVNAGDDTDELVPVTDWSDTYEVIRDTDATEALFRTDTTEEEAAARAVAPFAPEV